MTIYNELDFVYIINALSNVHHTAWIKVCHISLLLYTEQMLEVRKSHKHVGLMSSDLNRNNNPNSNFYSSKIMPTNHLKNGKKIEFLYLLYIFSWQLNKVIALPILIKI